MVLSLSAMCSDDLVLEEVDLLTALFFTAGLRVAGFLAVVFDLDETVLLTVAGCFFCVAALEAAAVACEFCELAAVLLVVDLVVAMLFLLAQ